MFVIIRVNIMQINNHKNNVFKLMNVQMSINTKIVKIIENVLMNVKRINIYQIILNNYIV